MPDYVDDSSGKHYHDDLIWKYWTDWLNGFNIPWEKIAKNQLAKWISSMEDMVGESLQYEFPTEWIDMIPEGAGDDDEEFEDLPYEHDEDD